MAELTHTKTTCTAHDLCLGGEDGLSCGNCGAGRKQPTTWKDNSSNYNGKELRAVVRVGDDIVDARLYYSPEYTEHKNQWGVTTRQGTGTYRIVLNASYMRNDGLAYVGGLGKSYTMSTGHKRRTMKELDIAAGKLGNAELIAASEGDYSPTLIVGRK